jgi:low affinity Fe/Cu permease
MRGDSAEAWVQRLVHWSVGSGPAPAGAAPMASEENKSPWTFSDLARRASYVLGTPVAFAIALSIVLIWLLSGPVFGYSDTWQLIINTGTTIITFLMVFLVQHTQNRDARALHLKLDELLRSIENARDRLIDLETCSDEELDQIERQFQALRRREQRNEGNREAIKR